MGSLRQVEHHIGNDEADKAAQSDFILRVPRIDSGCSAYTTVTIPGQTKLVRGLFVVGGPRRMEKHGAHGIEVCQDSFFRLPRTEHVVETQRIRQIPSYFDDVRVSIKGRVIRSNPELGRLQTITRHRRLQVR